MSVHGGDVYFDIKANKKPFNSAMRSLDATAGKIAGKVGRTIAAALSVAAFGKFIKDATAAGASLNAMNTIVDAALPNMREKVDEFAKSAGAMFGLSETQAKKFVGQYASMARSMGYTEEQAYKMSTALAGLAGDYASYYHISQDAAATKLKAVFSGETEALKEQGIVMTQNALNSYALANGYGRTTAQMSELEKTTLRYNFLLNQTKLAHGDFAKYANTWSGSIATMKLNWSNFMATLGQGLINILLPLLQVIARISQALTALGSRFLAWTQRVRGIKKPLASAFGKGTQKDLKKSAGGIGNVGKGLGGAGKSAKSAKKAVKALKRELMGFDQITKLTKQDTNTGTGSAGGIGGGGGISGGGIDFSDAEYDVKSFSETASDFLSKIKIPKALKDALSDLREAFGGLFDTLKTAGKWALDNILIPLGKWTINVAAPVQIEALASGINLLNAALKLLGAIFKPLWEPLIKPFFTFIGNTAIRHIQTLTTVFNLLTKVLTDATKGVANIKKAWSDVTKWFTNKSVSISIHIPSWNSIKDSWQKLMAKFKNKTVTVTIATTVKKGITTVQQAAKTAAKKVKASKGKKGKAGGGIYKNGRWQKVQGYAGGGEPNEGQLFYARERGPELVGTIGGHTAVMNNDQIVASVSAGVARAMSGLNMKVSAPPLKLSNSQAKQLTQNSELNIQEVNTLLRQIITIISELNLEVSLDGEAIKNNTVRRINNHTRSTGQLELLI